MTTAEPAGDIQPQTLDSQTLDSKAPAAGPDPEPGYDVGYGRPPAGRPFTPGVSGNPMGRPRRPVMVAGHARRLIPAEPSELEQALAQPVFCMAVDGGPVSLARAVVARLTERALTNGDVAACRELLRLTAEAEAVHDERALLAVEQEADREREAAAAEAARAKRERDLRDRAQDEARNLVELVAEDAARDAGEAELENHARALKLLDAVEFNARDKITAVKPWVAKAATAHSPRLPRGLEARPLDLADPAEALERLEILVDDEDGDLGVAGWFIDAARARTTKRRLAPGDAALLALVRVDEADADWVDRLAAVEAMMAGPAG